MESTSTHSTFVQILREDGDIELGSHLISVLGAACKPGNVHFYTVESASDLKLCFVNGKGDNAKSLPSAASPWRMAYAGSKCGRSPSVFQDGLTRARSSLTRLRAWRLTECGLAHQTAASSSVAHHGHQSPRPTAVAVSDAHTDTTCPCSPLCLPVLVLRPPMTIRPLPPPSTLSALWPWCAVDFSHDIPLHVVAA